MNEMDIVRTPELIGAEIRSLTTQARCITLWYGIEIGRRLTEAKEMVAHGEWLSFLEQQTEFSQPTASRFMRLFKEYGADQSSLFGAESKYSTLNTLSISNALKLLALPEEERESFAEENDLSSKSAREVEELIKQKLELEKALEKENEEHAIALADAKADCENARDELGKTAAQLQTARDRIRELESQPAAVAVERDEEAISAAVAEAKAEADKTIAKINKEHEKKLSEEAEKSRAALKELEELRATLADKQDEGEKQQLEQKIKALETKLKMAEPEVAAFQASFQRVQQEFNLMIEAMNRAPEDAREKLRAAARAVVDSFAARL